MEPARATYWAVLFLIVGMLVVASPALGAIDLTSEPRELGAGNATVSHVELSEPPAVEVGRFGTNRTYVRGPTATATVRSVTGAPRIVLRTEIPELGYDDAASRVIDRGMRGNVTVSVPDRPFSHDAIEFRETTVRTTVRIQSFDGDWVVHDRNHTVEVGR